MRRTGRSVVAGAGVIGAVSEVYTLDGLDRVHQVTSGPVTVSRTYDSLSRLTSETIEDRTVGYAYDDAGSISGITYPSGHPVVHGLDSLGRAETITSGGTQAAAYAFRGTSRVAAKTLGGGALAGTSSFDATGRMLHSGMADAAGAEVFSERLSWSPRDLKTAQTRTDRNDAGLALAHDGAGRLVLSAELSDPAATFPNNTAPSPAALAGAQDTFAFAYDAAQNLLARGTTEEGVPATVAMPPDASGRNRPASVGGVPLTWDPNGNLAAKGDLRFAYDDRNRLTRVTDAGGTEIARYEYDALNRRVRTVSGGATEETVWAGWQAAEVYRNGQLHQRRTWGLGLDEAVRLETDLDGDGALDTTHLPVYDSIGNLVAVTDTAGKPVERYRYTPFGQRRVFVDSTPPEIEQVRVVGNEIWLEVAEAVSAPALAEAVATGALTLVETATSTPLDLVVSQPVTEGRQAGRRLVVAPTATPAVGTEFVLTVAPDALVDEFLNRPATAFAQTFLWPAANAVIFDDEAPELRHVLLRDGLLEIQLSEEPALAAAAAAIQIDGAPVAWALGSDRYTLVSANPLSAASHDLTISTAGLDLAGQGLVSAFSATIGAQAVSSTSFVFREPDPREVESSAVGNGLGFQGLEVDAAVALVYVRNRWFDPEMGRFITTDPLHYIDGANLYAAFLNDPLNKSDPLGTDAFVVKYGPSLADADVYVTIQFVQSRSDSGMTEERFARVAADYLSAARATWRALNLRIIVGRSGFAESVGASWEIDSVSPFASQIILLSQRGTSHYHLIFTGNADAKRYAHEFGHLLGLRDYYSTVGRWNEKGGISIDVVPDVEQFGERAVESIMGGRATESEVPTSADIADILDLRRTLYELPMRTAPVHHLDISTPDLSGPIALFEEMAAKRGVDITAPLVMLREKRSIEGRRRVVEWIMSILFGPAPY